MGSVQRKCPFSMERSSPWAKKPGSPLENWKYKYKNLWLVLPPVNKHFLKIVI